MTSGSSTTDEGLIHSRVSTTDEGQIHSRVSTTDEGQIHSRVHNYAAVIQSASRFISEAVQQPFTFALELHSRFLLSNSQMDKLITVDQIQEEEKQKTYKNYKILRVIQKDISINPNKFDTLCAVFDTLQLTECSIKLKGNS